MRGDSLIPDYEQSWALLIGIDEYQAGLPPLTTATRGARELAGLLSGELGFQPDHVITLINEQATQRAIRRTLTDPFSRGDKVGPNDRVVVYYAGHGVTFDTAQGEVGCIAPYDAEQGYIDSTIPMDELTRLANRIHAKHVLFLLDACFSGFATTREASSGVERQVRDFMVRPTRQVITAGTREQAVSDSWGPGGHSLFTGFLIDGLSGAAPAPAGVLRAFHLAGFLQDQVAQHSRSLQTPQYAALMGSQGGDFIFSVRRVASLDPLLLAALDSSDATQRLAAVGRLRTLGMDEDRPDHAAQALAKLEELIKRDPDRLVRSAAEEALREIVPQTTVAPVVREELAEVPTGADAEQVEIPDLHLIAAAGPVKGRHLVPGVRPITLGRTPDNSVPLDDPRVSRHHARLFCRGGALWAEDLDSTNGTLVNGERITAPRQLAAGDVVEVGQTRLTVTDNPPEVMREATLFDIPLPTPGADEGATEPNEVIEAAQAESAAAGDGFVAAPTPAPAGQGFVDARTPAPAASSDQERRRRSLILLIAIIIGACVLMSCLAIALGGNW